MQIALLSVLIIASLPIPTLTKSHIQLEPRHVQLSLERNHYTTFRFLEVNTTVELAWEDLPLLPTAWLSNSDCPGKLSLDLEYFEYPQISLCLFKRIGWTDEIFGKDVNISVLDDIFNDTSELLTATQKVSGYIQGNPYSKINGYLVDGKFYGDIRFFDKLRVHHVVFYAETKQEVEIKYRQRINSGTSGQHANAIIFEYVPRTDTNIDLTSRKDADGFFSQENIRNEDRDVVNFFRFRGGKTSHQMFDGRGLVHFCIAKFLPDQKKKYICRLCVWIQPNFAYNFGMGGSILKGIVEVLDILELLNWTFRAIDFDQDNFPENIGFRIEFLSVTDQIRITDTAGEPIIRSTDKRGGSPEEKENAPAQKPYKFSARVGTIPPKSALSTSTERILSHFGDWACCAWIAFVFHEMAPALSATNLRGICTKLNVMVLTGLYKGKKITKYDLSRALLHAVGHLFGGHHDDMTDGRCHEMTRFEFINPFVMHPVQQFGVGLRGGSFRFSECTKEHIAQFLSSNGIPCLEAVEDPDSFCGNGILEDGEECDCGSLWQCHISRECCLEADTVGGCTILDPYKRKACKRPKLW